MYIYRLNDVLFVSRQKSKQLCKCKKKKKYEISEFFFFIPIAILKNSNLIAPKNELSNLK